MSTHHPSPFVFDETRLSEPAYFEDIRQRMLNAHSVLDRSLCTWFLSPHCHRCPHCSRTLTHTGLQALRDGDARAHQCCGADVRPRTGDVRPRTGDV